MGLELAKVFVKVRADSSNVGRDFQDVRRKVGRQIAKIGALAGAAIGVAGAIGAVRKAVDLAADLEQTTVAFETMIGSASKAKEVLDDIQKFAAATPFQLTDLQKSAKILMAFGVEADNLLPTMKMLGDISSGSGKNLGELTSIFGKIMAQGRLTAETLNQLSEAAVPVGRVLSEQFGVSEAKIREMVSAGKIGFPEVQAAMLSMTQEGGVFQDMMQKQSQTLTGVMSTVRDNLDQVFLRIGNALLPAAKQLGDVLLNLVQALDGWLGPVLDKVVNFVKNFIKGIWFIFDNWGEIWAAMVTSAAIRVSSIMDFFSNLWSAIPQIATAGLNAVIVQTKAWVSFMRRSFDRILDMWKVVGSTMKGVWDAFWSGDSLTEPFKDAFNDMMSIQIDQMKDLALTQQAGAEEFARGIAGIDLFKKSGGTKALEQELERITENLARRWFTPDTAAPELEKAGETLGNKAAQQITQATKPMLEAGRVGFPELGKKLQDVLLKGEDDQKKMVGLLEKGNQMQDELIKAVKEQQPVGALT